MLNGVPRILIIRLGAIGDVVRVLPALHCLRDAFPNAQIDWLTDSQSFDVVDQHPAIDSILILEAGDGQLDSARKIREMGRRIRANRYDKVIDFEGVFSTGVITRYSGAPERYGFGGSATSLMNRLSTNRKTHLGQEVENAMQVNLALCEQFSKGWKSLDVVLGIPDDAADLADDFMEENFDGAKKVVAVHVPGNRPENQWPLEFFAELVDMLLSDGRFEVLLTWGPHQEEAVRKAAEMTHRTAVIAPEMDGLKYYMALVRECELYFGGDGGPMHIASALDVPVVAVFGGTDPARNGPLRQPNQVLRAQDAEGQNTAYLRNNGARLMREISPEDAYDACVRMAQGDY